MLYWIVIFSGEVGLVVIVVVVLSRGIGGGNRCGTGGNSVILVWYW